MHSYCYTCVVIILPFPLLVWPSLQPSPPWWTTTSATTTWGQWSPSQCTLHPRSPRPGTHQFPDTCLGKKTSQGRLKTGSSMNDSIPMRYTHIDTMSVGLNNHIMLSGSVDISWSLLLFYCTSSKKHCRRAILDKIKFLFNLKFVKGFSLFLVVSGLLLLHRCHVFFETAV